MKLTKEAMQYRMEFTKDKQKEAVESFKRLNKLAVKGQILFTGSSLMEQFPINEIAMNHGLNKIIYNRGIGGFTTFDFIENIEEQLFGVEPKYVFINIGTNDLKNLEDGTPWQESLKKNLTYIYSQLKERLPETIVYTMAYYPMNEKNEEFSAFAKFMGTIRSNETLKEASDIERKLTEEFGFHYIDVNEGLAGEDGNLKQEFCKDAIHFFADGYEVVYKNLEKYLENLK